MQFLDQFRTELRRGWSRAARSPFRSAAGALTLSLGIGASTLAFSAVRAVLLEPLPVADQQRLVVMWQRSEARDFDRVPFLPAALPRVGRIGGPLEAVAAVSTIGATPTTADGPDGPLSIEHTRVAGDFFGVLGVVPALGRMLDSADDGVGAIPVGVVSHDFWTAALGGRADAVGTSIRVADVSFEIVGVAPPDFDYPRGTELWVTLGGTDPDGAGPIGERAELDVVARLSPGATLADAAAAIDALFAADAELALLAADLRATGVGLVDVVVGDTRPVLLVTLAAGLVLLGVAIANATLLFLAGGLRAGRELAVRRALGAGRASAVAPLLADATVQAGLGVVGGVLLAAIGLGVLIPLAPADFARFSTIDLDVRSLAFAGALGSAALTLSAGLAGVWLSRHSPATVLGGARGTSEGGVVLRRVIAGTQVALAVTAAVAALLLVDNVRTLERLDRGFEPEGLYLVSFRQPFDFFSAPPEFGEVLRTVSQGLAARPGIEGASPTFNVPLVLRGGIDFAARVDDQTPEEAQGNPYVGFDAVLPTYFDVAGTELLEGRHFGAQDGPDDDPVAIVNAAAARALWPDGSPLGRRIYMGGLSRNEWRTVVGVVEDHRFRTFPGVHPSVWLPLAQFDRFAPSRILVRAGPAAGSIGSAVDEEFAAAYPGVDVIRVQALEEVMRGPLRRPRFAAATLLALSLVTLLLAGLGVHNVLAVIVAERRRDLGIRVALGARALDLGRHLARHLLWIGLGGALAGAWVSVWGVRLVESLLFAGAPGRGSIIAGVLVTTCVLVVVAGILPLRRAAGVDPAGALRTE